MFASITMFQMLGGIGLILIIVAILNRKAFSRFMESISAQIGKAGMMAWARDPIAIAQHRIDSYASEIAEATHGLEEYRGHISHVSRSIMDGEKECTRLDALVKSNLKDGNRDKAGTYVGQLQREQEHLKSYQEQLGRHQKGYDAQVAKIKRARENIVEERRKLALRGAELKMSQAEANLADLSTKFNVNASLDGMGEIDQELQRQIDKNNAKSQVLADLGDDPSFEEQERLRKDNTDALLAQYESSMKK